MPDSVYITLKGQNGEVTATVMTGPVENEPVKRVSSGSRMAAHVDEIIGVSGHATGALEGRLETITIHGQNVFTIYDPLRRRGTRCICDADTLDATQGLLGHRVLGYGDVGYNKGGEPIIIRVEQFQLLPGPRRAASVARPARDVRSVGGHGE